MDNFLTFLITKKGIMTVCASVSTVTFGSYQFNDFVHEKALYESLNIQFMEQAPAIEYGDTSYDLNSLIETKEGDITLPTLDVTQVGEQTLVFKVSKEDQMKEFTKVVNVQDTQAPVITLTAESTSIEFEKEFDVASLIKSVQDPVDGDILLGTADAGTSYYAIDGTVDVTTPGDYTISVKAVDNHGMEANASSVVTVKKEKKIEEKDASSRSNYTAPDASGIAGGVVGIATSYNGASYSYGGTSPSSGFDCSGFVQYVFGQAGVSVPRTAGAQGASGTPVASADMQPGDVVVYNGGSHVAIYVGNGQIVHALNPSQGVQTTGMGGYGSITAISRY